MININDIKNIIKDGNFTFRNIDKIGIFGSVARGEQDDTSDIDVIVSYINNTDEVSDQTIDEIDNFIVSFEKIANSYGVPKVDLVTLNGVLKSENQKVSQNILKDTIWVYEN